MRSLPGSADSSLTMDLTANGNVITGTWVEQTSSDGYYRGARYHGAIQLLAEPTVRRLAGKWLGFGKGMDITPAHGNWSSKTPPPARPHWRSTTGGPSRSRAGLTR